MSLGSGVPREKASAPPLKAASRPIRASTEALIRIGVFPLTSRSRISSPDRRSSPSSPIGPGLPVTMALVDGSTSSSYW